MVNTNTWQTSLSLQSFNLEVPVDDHERIEKVQEYVANYINADWIESLTATSERSRRLSPPAFRYQLTELARKAGKRVVLPEGDEPRTVKAAAICAERGIATCVLLGNPDEINRVAAAQGVELGAGIEIVDPEVVRESYVGRLVELRKNKGMTEAVAREQLEDNVVLGTLMLEQDEVDGLVSGAVHTTANTIRPPLQLIKTAPGSSLVSSVFFMLLPEQVYVYGDCAINPDPTAEQLAEIAIQSAESAIAFGIEPRVAMLSYSTGTSGAGSDVEKVREATRLAQEKRPDLMIDGPLQYDAAVMADVAKSKAPNSPVAGRATVFIFPDLNTGNTTYKAVQRSADLISIGPMLQGMRKLDQRPVPWRAGRRYRLYHRTDRDPIGSAAEVICRCGQSKRQPNGCLFVVRRRATIAAARLRSLFALALFRIIILITGVAGHPQRQRFQGVRRELIAAGGDLFRR